MDSYLNVPLQPTLDTLSNMFRTLSKTFNPASGVLGVVWGVDPSIGAESMGNEGKSGERIDEDGFRW